MTFKLTQEHVQSVMDEVTKGNWGAVISLMDDKTEWWIAADKYDPESLAGVYNLATWQEKIGSLLPKLFVDLGTFECSSIDVIGQKAIIEAKSHRTQKNGEPFDVSFCWIFFYGDHGKLVKFRDYADTAAIVRARRDNPVEA